MEFTQAEFDLMVHQLLFEDTPSFDMLCRIADQTLQRMVALWCNQDDCLRGRGYEEDIMQEIRLRLIKTTVNHFLLLQGVEGPVNNDPEGFRRWIITVAKNVKRDFSNRIRAWYFHTKNLDELGPEAAAPEGFDDDRNRIDSLREAFDVVLEADVGIYKILTWLAQFVFILNTGVSKIRSNELIIETFENRTLYEMYDMVLSASERIPWLRITPEQNKRIMAALQKRYEDDITYGEAKYREFYMKQNGVPAPKKSISDWVNRMNDSIRRRINAPAKKTRSRRSSVRRQGNGSSDS